MLRSSQGTLQFVHTHWTAFGLEGVNDFAGAHRTTFLQQEVNPRHRFTGDALLLRPTTPRHAQKPRQGAKTVCSTPAWAADTAFQAVRCG